MSYDVVFILIYILRRKVIYFIRVMFALSILLLYILNSDDKIILVLT